MAGVNREIRFNIRADVDQAIRAIGNMGREFDEVAGKAKGDFSAKTFNDNVRESVGVLGDIDSAMQTLGSTLQIEGLQIVGDFFALGEGVAQLAGAVPLLLSTVTTAAAALGTALLPIGLVAGAIAGLTIALTENQRQIELSKKAFEDMNERIENFGDEIEKMKLAQLESEAFALAVQMQVLADTLFAGQEAGNLTNEQLETLNLNLYEARTNLEAANTELEKRGFETWADNVRELTNLTVDESNKQKKALEEKLALETRVYEEAVRRYGENSDAALEAATTIDELNAALDFMANVDYSQSIAQLEEVRRIENELYIDRLKWASEEEDRVSALGQEGFQNLSKLGDSLGGLFGKMKDNVLGTLGDFTDAYKDNQEQAFEDQIKAQEAWAKEQERIAKEQERLAKEQVREREREWANAERMNRAALERVKGYERRKYEIEQGYRDATFDALLGNDVEAFLSARRERRQARREERMFGTTLDIGTVVVGSLSTKEDLEEAKRILVDAVSNAMAQQAGKF